MDHLDAAVDGHSAATTVTSGDTDPAFDYFISRMESFPLGATPVISIVQYSRDQNVTFHEIHGRLVDYGREGHVHSSLQWWHWLRLHLRGVSADQLQSHSCFATMLTDSQRVKSPLMLVPVLCKLWSKDKQQWQHPGNY